MTWLKNVLSKIFSFLHNDLRLTFVAIGAALAFLVALPKIVLAVILIVQLAWFGNFCVGGLSAQGDTRSLTQRVIDLALILVPALAVVFLLERVFGWRFLY